MDANPSITLFKDSDIPALYKLAQTGQHHIEPDYFETALKEQNDQKRMVFVATAGDNVLGYVHLNFLPQYTPFLRLGIPEIQDLFVHPDFRRYGIGTALIETCEQQVRMRGGDEIGIGVGMVSTFGSAQKLYTRLGYVPDGAGVVFERVPVMSGEVRPIDDRLCLMLMKSL